MDICGELGEIEEEYNSNRQNNSMNIEQLVILQFRHHRGGRS